MKAVILVGGLGTRLRPLTCSTPKPLLPLVGRTFIDYVIDHLTRFGIDQIILSAGYLPDNFRQHIAGYGGDRVIFVAEDEPLGTCGAVKNVEHLLDDTFMVFNGDILTDLNLAHLLEYHNSKKAVATLTLTSVDDPTAYGLVPRDSSGKVEGFLEKPSWDEVTTDLINAGTYVLEPQVLELAPKGENYSFERGLFPLLLERGLPVFGFPSDAYWLDIGTPEKYLRAHHDILEGKVAFDFEGTEVKTRVWSSDGVSIDPAANVFGPVVLGSGCRVEEHAQIVGPAVIGSNCVVSKGVRLESSVAFEDCFFGEGAVVRKSLMGAGIRIGDKVHVEEVSVLGQGVSIGDENWLKRGIRIWPGTQIQPGTIRF